MPELRVLMWFFAIFFHRVAWGGARWDPIALLAREHIGITRYGKCIVGLNLEAGLSLPRQKNSWALSLREPRRVAMPNVWAGTTLDGVQCRLNSEPAGLVAHVGKGGKKISRRVARPSTSLFECVAAMERVLDRSQTPLPSPADLHAILCGLPLLWLEAGQRFESGE